VLWLRPDGESGHTYLHAGTITITNPVDAVDVIADAAIAALVRSAGGPAGVIPEIPPPRSWTRVVCAGDGPEREDDTGHPAAARHPG
jgi:hypothetical protein